LPQIYEKPTFNIEPRPLAAAGRFWDSKIECAMFVITSRRNETGVPILLHPDYYAGAPPGGGCGTCCG
jgi:hypothetical protein